MTDKEQIGVLYEALRELVSATVTRHQPAAIDYAASYSNTEIDQACHEIARLQDKVAKIERLQKAMVAAQRALRKIEGAQA